MSLLAGVVAIGGFITGQLTAPDFSYLLFFLSIIIGIVSVIVWRSIR